MGLRVAMFLEQAYHRVSMQVTPHFAKRIPLTALVLTQFIFPIVYVVAQVLFPDKPIFLWQLLFLAVPCAFVLQRYQVQGIWQTKDFWRLFAWVTIGSLSLTLIINEVLIYWEVYFPFPPDMQDLFDGLFHPDEKYGWAFDIFQIAIMPAIAEELYFRGVLQTLLIKYMHPIMAVGLTAMIFAFYHVNPWHLPFLFVLGFFFGWVTWKTGNLGFAMLGHFINNAFGVWVYYLEH